MVDFVVRTTIQLIFWGSILIVLGVWLKRWTAETRAGIKYLLGYTLVHRDVISGYEHQIKTLERNLNYYLQNPVKREKSGQLSMFNEVPKANGQRIPVVLYNHETCQWEEWSLSTKEYRLYQDGKIKVQRQTGKRRNGLPETQILWIDETTKQQHDVELNFDWKFERIHGEQVLTSEAS